ncbi:hypothetical protein PIB30_091719, partial [Stylosanthes scabra]|nr:hypothetical protein [Stylosanthes scabra]
MCTFYQKVCAYGSRCRYKQVNVSQASSSANGRQSVVLDSVAAHAIQGASSSWVPRATKISSSDKQASTSGAIP